MTRTRSDPDPDPALVLRYGLAVFPMPPGRKQPAAGWRDTIITTERELGAWPGGGANVGVACRVSRVVGLDLDVHPRAPNGIATLVWLAEQHGQGWPDTLTVATPSGGHTCTSARPTT
jgi:hypothetical protein